MLAEASFATVTQTPRRASRLDRFALHSFTWRLGKRELRWSPEKILSLFPPRAKGPSYTCLPKLASLWCPLGARMERGLVESGVQRRGMCAMRHHLVAPRIRRRIRWVTPLIEASLLHLPLRVPRIATKLLLIVKLWKYLLSKWTTLLKIFLVFFSNIYYYYYYWY